MEAKLAAGIAATEDSLLLNPFVHHLELETTSEKIKTAFLTIVLLPIRVCLICILLIVGWMLACLGLWGLTEQDLQKRPVTGWRSKVKVVASYPVLWMFYVGGFRVKVIGRRAPRCEASVISLAPHSSFTDSIAMVYLNSPSIVAKGETASIPFFGKLINFTQPVYVWRDDPDSRQNTIKEIISRATSKEDWPQILIFPEGTCTNRSCLITFKPGAFYPGVPIQPVCIRYPNKLDTVTWTWEGPSALKLLWLTLTQVYSYCEIEFLPVYTPSEEEKRDPKLFASNVRAVMAKALGVPVMDYTYDDCKLMTRAKEMNLPNANVIVEVQKLRTRLGLDQTKIEECFIENLSCQDCSQISYVEFSSYLNVAANDGNAQRIFNLYEKNKSGSIDFREYVLGVVGVTENRKTLEILRLAFKIYDSSGKGRLSENDFVPVLVHTLSMSIYESREIFQRIDSTCQGYVTFDGFLRYAEKKAEFAGLFSLSKEELRERNNSIVDNNKVKSH
ncbi:PREDICTED: lysophosphatidylcholine acyltransferase isoform X1 [Nicrophorus vespilloides]|uniref:Lysophosphatidylcholine acyltransferase isoform X1 n=1 Tax=Nicrophorus vespilloides TaxID=110193 RepID=A0ABM1MZ28_NICVS|nr:PREDICTED: lysophosphatidylcholine acyltransferase isoform X1 [Nicrophorus vespilloides]